MKRARVIPILLLNGRGLYKSFGFKDAKYLGDPINTVRIFNDKQCDELIIIDTHISKNNAHIDYEYIAEIASECFMPLCYGGGINALNQIENLLRLGIEKVSVNSLLVKNKSLVREAVQVFGSSTIVASIDVKRNLLGQYRLYEHTSRSIAKTTIDDILKTLNDIGVGEVLVNVVDLDGTMKGYDIQLAKKISDALDMPAVFTGGCRNFEDIKQLLTSTSVSAAGVGSYFVFHGPHRAVLINYPNPSEISCIYS